MSARVRPTYGCTDCKDTGSVWVPGSDASPGYHIGCSSCLKKGDAWSALMEFEDDDEEDQS